MNEATHLSRPEQALSARPDLILLHGWSYHPLIWQPVRARLPADLVVRAPALPGHGHSMCEHGPVVSNAHDWLGALFGDPARADGAVIAGWSLGGLLALAAVVKGLVRPRALVMVASLPRFVAASAGEGVGIAAIEEMAAGIRRGESDRVLRRFDALLRRNLHLAPPARAQIAAWRTGAVLEPEGLLQGLEWLRETDLCAALQSLPLPVTLVLGTDDPLCPAGRGASIAASSGAALRICARQGHWLPLTAADEVADCLVQTL
ncbi:MAG: alpha/beta fold hydrolase [Halothiobacillaceae bacterium]